MTDCLNSPGQILKGRLLPLFCVVSVFIAGNSLFVWYKLVFVVCLFALKLVLLVFMVSCFAAPRVLTILGDGWIIGLGQCVVQRFDG